MRKTKLDPDLVDISQYNKFDYNFFEFLRGMQNNNLKWGQLLVLSGQDTHLICLAGHFLSFRNVEKYGAPR
jgi:hypothetical protein